MSAMVDRVAKAAANAYYEEDCWDALTEEQFDQWLAAARAAIAAMREPTPEMENAWYPGVEKHDPGGLISPDGYSFNLYGWQAMIDAALAPPSIPTEKDTPKTR